MKLLLFSILFIVSIGYAETEYIPEIKTDLSYADRQEWQHFLDWPQKYETAFLRTHSSIEDDSPAFMRFYALEDAWHLLEINTFSGAYQPGYIYMLYNENWQEGFMVSFPTAYVVTDNVDDNERNASSYRISSQIEVAALPTFDERKGELELFFRSRGAGGCGTLNRYRFEYESAYLISIRSQSCEEADAQGEDMILSPHDWPLVWPPQTKPSEN